MKKIKNDKLVNLLSDKIVIKKESSNLGKKETPKREKTLIDFSISKVKNK